MLFCGESCVIIRSQDKSSIGSPVGTLRSVVPATKLTFMHWVPTLTRSIGYWVRSTILVLYAYGGLQVSMSLVMSCWYYNMIHNM